MVSSTAIVSQRRTLSYCAIGCTRCIRDGITVTEIFISQTTRTVLFLLHHFGDTCRHPLISRYWYGVLDHHLAFATHPYRLPHQYRLNPPRKNETPFTLRSLRPLPPAAPPPISPHRRNCRACNRRHQMLHASTQPLAMTSSVASASSTLCHKR